MSRRRWKRRSREWPYRGHRAWHQRTVPPGHTSSHPYRTTWSAANSHLSHTWEQRPITTNTTECHIKLTVGIETMTQSIWKRIMSLIAGHRRRSSVNFKGRHCRPKNMYEKLTKCQNFTWFLPEKLWKYPNFMVFARKMNKFPEFYNIFARKNARILHNNCPKNIYPDFFSGGDVPICPLPAVSYAYFAGCSCFRAINTTLCSKNGSH